MDAYKYGVGGVWLSGIKTLSPIVWRLEWPQEIVDAFTVGDLPINNLEMAGILLHFIILDYLVDVKHCHVAIWCDNTLAVSWTMKLSSTKSVAGQQLTHALTMRMSMAKSSPLAALSIAGKENVMADLPSRSYNASAAPETMTGTI